MPFSGPGLSSEIEAKLAPWDGRVLTPFSFALGNGIVLSLQGKLKYNTTDVGTIPGSGNGTTTGMKGLNEAAIASLMFTKGQSVWSSFQRDGPGVQWQIFCDKIAAAVVAHFKINPVLSSAHSPVFVGVGTVKSYFGVTIQQMAGIITAQAPAQWQAKRFPELALAVATGVMTEVLTHSPKEKMAISGSGGIPVPGGGTGIGNVF